MSTTNEGTTVYDGTVAGEKVEYDEWVTVDRRDLLEIIEEPGDIHLCQTGGGIEPFVVRVVKKDLERMVEDWGDIPLYMVALRPDGDYALMVELDVEV